VLYFFVNRPPSDVYIALKVKNILQFVCILLEYLDILLN